MSFNKHKSLPPTIGHIFLWIVLAANQAFAGNWHVDQSAVGSNNGLSWANAFVNPQSALSSAVSGDTIFVAQGTYKPDLTAPGNRNLSFNMKNGVVLLGGFPAGGGALSTRNWTLYPTILSGDIGTAGIHTDNSFHVVRCNGQAGELNGFIVERGRADGAAPDNDGGGMFATSGYLASVNCIYRNNYASDQGGGTYHDSGGNPTYRQCKFEGNSASMGGGSYAFAATIISNCSYVGNSATSNGGGVYAVVNINMYNCTFKGNSATTSGNAIYYQSGGSNRLFNGIVWANSGSATHVAGAGSINLRNCNIEGGCPGGGATCTTIYNIDPQFSDVAGHLAPTSWMVDQGDNNTGDGNSDGLTVDLDNLNRNFDAIPGGATRDIGAYESQVLNLRKHYVDHTATGANNGSSWADAFVDFQSAVAAANAGDTVLVAKGTHFPSVGPTYSRTRKFTLVEGVRYYGGFPNGGGSFAQRDFSANRTILSGDIGTLNDSTDNCFVVVDATNLTASTLMSGFTVERGNADSSSVFVMYGRAGGMHLGATGSIRLDSLTFRNNKGNRGSAISADAPTAWSVRGSRFENNTTTSAVMLQGGSGTFQDCYFSGNTAGNGGAVSLNSAFNFIGSSFIGNRATASGGGGAVYGGAGSTFTNCTFTSNTATAGPGGAYNKFSGVQPNFTNCTFTGNSGGGGFGGGAIYSSSGGFNVDQCVFRQNFAIAPTTSHGGAMYNNGGTCSITNSVFYGNYTQTGLGGAIYNNTGGTVNLRNCSFANNTATGYTQGGALNNNSNSNATITNCIFWDNVANGNNAASLSEIGHGSGTLTTTYSIWQGNVSGGTIYNFNPLFINQGTGDLTLTLCSPAIDTGTAASMPVVDQTGATRPVDARPGGLTYDLGAYEFQTSAVDVTPPTALCQNLTLNLNGAGVASTTATAINNGSTDNCGVTGLSIDVSSFTCANIGPNTVTLTVSDATGNSSTCTSTVTVADITPPTALCQNQTVYLDGAGSASITAAMANNGSIDNCSISSLAVNPSSANCQQINTAKLFISDNTYAYKTDFNHGNRFNLTPSSSTLRTLAVAATKDSIFIGDFNAGRIERVHLNGGTATPILTGITPFGVAVDEVNGKIYWTDPNGNTINRCNLNGTGNQVIISGATEADYSRMIKVDPINGKIYWTDANLGTVKRANLDGTGIQTIITGQGNIVGLDLDVTQNKLFFTTYSLNSVRRANLDGTGLTTIAGGQTLPLGLAVDRAAQKVYFVQGSGVNMLKSCDYNGAGLTTIATGLAVPYDINLIPALPVTLTATDQSNNSGTCVSQMTIRDTIKPVALCRNLTVYLNGAGAATITENATDNGSTDNCGIFSYNTDINAFTCANVGLNTVSMTVTDASNNSRSCSATVTVQDTIDPAAVCRNITVQLNASGTSTITGAMLNNGSTDACGIASLTPSTTAFTCANIGANPVTLTVTDVNGNTRTCTSTVTVQDTVDPVATCQNITVQLNTSGTSTITGAMLNNGSTDACGIASLTPSTTAFTCTNIGSNTVTLTVTDVNGNSRTCTSTVTVQDTVDPVATCQNITVQLNPSGTSTITGAMLNNGSTDACGIASLTPSTTAFTCTNIGSNTVALTVTDVNGNSRTCTSTVTVQDTVDPVATCQNITVQLNASGNATITGAMLNNGSTDACGIASLTPSTTAFTCTNIGANPVTLTVTDVNGNTRTCTSTVTVQDTVDPVATCQNITVQLNASGNATITGAMLNNGSTDACGIASLTPSTTAFSCANIGANTVTLTVTDVNGNSSTCNSTVTVQDTVDPVATCQNITVQLNASGNATITGAMLNNGSTDACGIATLTPSTTAFTCANIGSNAVTLTVTDVNGNSSTCNSTVTVADTVDPVAVCQNITVQLNASGNATITGAMLNNGSTDACGIASLTPSITAFTCASIGSNAVTLSVTDVNGNSSTCNGTVTVADTVDPVATCQNITVQLNASGNATITGAMLNNGSTDACGIASLTPSTTAFTCANIGSNAVTLTVTDVNGNSSTCNGMVTVADTVDPVAVCQNITVQLNASGNATITGAMLNNGSTDACGIASLTPSTTAFSCANIGANTVTLTVTDLNGNSSTCNSTVTVQDTVDPVAVCQNITVQLNASGNATITGAMINNGSTDACGIASLTPSTTAFTCANIGSNAVTLTVTDVNGNSSTCNSTVTVADTVDPVAVCQNITVQLNASGNATITGAMLNNGSTDACGIASLTPSTTAFTCANIGANPVTLTVTDVNGNTSTCNSTVTVADTVDPVAVCQNVTVQLNASGNATITGAMLNNGSTDACGIASLTPSTTAFTCANIGSNAVTLTVTDVNGNSSTCNGMVTVADTVDPVAVCQNITVQLNASGNATITGAMLNNGSTDACGIASLTPSTTAFSCANIGANPVTLTVTDVNGHSSTCNGTVTVADTVDPVAVCQNITVQLNASGNATITGAMLNNGSTDACGIASLTPSSTAFSCANIGANTVTLTVTDVNSNSSTCNSTVTVQDTVDPVATCQNITVQLNASGNATITGAMLNNGSTDACGIASLPPSTTAFSCANIGANPVTLTVTDLNGNSSTCNSTVTVQDTVDPVAVCQNITVQLNASGNATITGAMINNGSTDACGIASLTPSTTAFTCANIGSNAVTLTVTDVNGNSSTCNSTVTVQDTNPPALTCNDTALVMPTSGGITLTEGMLLGSLSDACGLDTVFLSQYTFACADTGMQNVTLTAMDVNGNTSTCAAIVTILPTPFVISPVADLKACGYAVSCAGNADGSAQLTVSGGCEPYQVLWSSGSTALNINGLAAGTYSVTVTDGIGRIVVDSVVITEPQPVVATGFATELVCAGASNGSIDVTVIGGNNCVPYQFAWSNGAVSEDISGLQPGNYSLLVTDTLGCSDSIAFIIGTQPLPVVDLGVDTLKCIEDTLRLDAGAGYASVFWSNAATSQAIDVFNPGTYSVTVMDSVGCQGLDAIIIGNRPRATNFIQYSGLSQLCIGDEATLSMGAGFSAGVWSTGDSTSAIVVGGPVTTYFVTADDAAGCLATDTISLNFVNSLAIAPVIVPGPQVTLCQGSTVDLDAGPGYAAYAWNAGGNAQTVNVGAAGAYVVTVTDSVGCQAVSDTVNVASVPTPVVSIVQTNDTLFSVSAWVTYQWYVNGGVIPGANLSFHIPGQTGFYQLVATDSNGCSGTSNQIFSLPVGIDGNNPFSLELYPNPTRGEFKLRALQPVEWPVEVIVTDLYGHRVGMYEVAQLMNGTAFDVSGLSAGTYFVEIRIDQMEPVVKKLVIQ